MTSRLIALAVEYAMGLAFIGFLVQDTLTQIPIRMAIWTAFAGMELYCMFEEEDSHES